MAALPQLVSELSLCVSVLLACLIGVRHPGNLVQMPVKTTGEMKYQGRGRPDCGSEKLAPRFADVAFCVQVMIMSCRKDVSGLFDVRW